MYRIAIVIFSIYCVISSLSYATSQQSNTQIEQKTESDKSLEFINAWARPQLTHSGAVAVYLTIKNNSKQPYTLVGATNIGIANNIELHQTVMQDNKAIMKSLDKIVIPANSEIKLQPNGIHIMLTDVKTTLKDGDKFKLNLMFAELKESKIVKVEISRTAPRN